MNAERLNALLGELRSEFKNTNLPEKFDYLVNNLEKHVNQPVPAHQQALSSSLQQLYQALSNPSSDGFSPSWRQLLEEIGGDELCGTKLKKRIEVIMLSNQMTPAVALDELKELHKRLKKFYAALEGGNEALKTLNIGDEKLAPGQCEIGIQIPRNIVSDLTGISKEFKEIAFILNSFSEVVAGHQSKLTLKTISSSDFLMFVESYYPLAACIAVTIERIVATYKNLLEIRKHHRELKKSGVPEEMLAGIKSHASTLMDKKIEELAEDIIINYSKTEDEIRQNELKNAVRLSLNKLATRIDRGFNFEVRVSLPTQDSQESKDPSITEAIHKIQSATANMQFLKLDGDPILSLPDTNRDQEAT